MVYIIVFIDFYVGSIRAPLDLLGVALQPCERKLVVGQGSLELLGSQLVRSVNPVLLLLREQSRLNHLVAVGDHRDVLKPVERSAAEVVLRLDLLDNDDILDTDAKVAVLIIARLVRKDVAELEGELGVRRTGTNAHRALVDVEEGANTVTGAVAEVKASILLQLACVPRRFHDAHTQRNCLAKASSA